MPTFSQTRRPRCFATSDLPTLVVDDRLEWLAAARALGPGQGFGVLGIAE
ncbi:MAG TPA: hypothetical protein VJ258_01045 [Candidatus Limnocylindrales bacterium]|jgi:hypothetical protein|nr:hypothetical protein [Candidatus Limnocylindrales bacterium]